MKPINSANSSLISATYSYLGSRCILGNVEAVTYLYGNAWKESPALIRTIEQLQYCLTSAEIDEDTDGIYNSEFLYYWGMICMGEVSPLIVKDLGTARTCFNKIKKIVPKVRARLAYIALRLSEEPAKSDSNVERLGELRQWASRHDMFSLIALSKISFFQYLQEYQECETDIPELPIQALRLIGPPYQKGHPVAVKFHNDIYTHIGINEAMLTGISESRINADVLYDYY